jgi:hypothetical protein
MLLLLLLQNEARGINVQHFGELLMSSGIVLNDEIRWITFHSGYDFGYLLKVRLTVRPVLHPVHVLHPLAVPPALLSLHVLAVPHALHALHRILNPAPMNML